jgi:hypothetical protein
MRLVACPYCLSHLDLPADWEEEAFLCAHCKRTVNAAEALPTVTPRVQHAVFLGAALTGALVAFAEFWAEGPGAGGSALKLRLLLTFWGALYVTVVLSYRALGMTADALAFWRGVRGILLINALVGVLLILTSGGALINATELRPSLMVGLLTFWFSLRGVVRTRASDRTYAGRWGDSLADSGRAAGLRIEVPTYSESVGAMLNLARFEATSLGQAFIGTQHLLLAFAKCKSGPVREALTAAGVTVEKLLTALAPHLDRDAVELPANDLPITPTLRRVIEQAEAAARVCSAEGATPEQLLVVLLADPESVVADALAALGIDPKRVSESLTRVLTSSGKA